MTIYVTQWKPRKIGKGNKKQMGKEQRARRYVDCNYSVMSKIKLEANSLNITDRVSDQLIKQRPVIWYLWEIHFKYEDTPKDIPILPED